VDDDLVGPLPDPVVVSALRIEGADLDKRARHLQAGRTFIYHCAEGQRGTRVTEEFEDLARAGCLSPGLVAIHCSALDRSHFARWRAAARPAPGAPAGTVVWSPFSNLWLYGMTTDVPAALENGLAVALGTDWGPSGTRTLLGEIKVARLWSDREGWGLTDHDLVAMITAAPGDAVSRAWQSPVGRLEPGALGDVTVLSRRKADPWANVVAARERDVVLVAVGSKARYGTKAHMDKAGERQTTAVRVGAVTRRVTLVRPDDPSRPWSWRDIQDRLKAVIAHARVNPPVGPQGSALLVTDDEGLPGDPAGTPPLAATPDMPGGPQEVAGPPPPGQTVEIPPIQPLAHDKAWLASLRGRGFHGGVLDGLAAFYR
jgi:5-methylthioadenosine/S-adenosylhomocysteine deaminase